MTTIEPLPPQQSQSTPPIPIPTATETPRTTSNFSLYSLSSFTSYLSSRVSFAITREQRYTLSPTSNTAATVISSLHDGDGKDNNAEENAVEYITNTSKLLRNSI